jgi:integrase
MGYAQHVTSPRGDYWIGRYTDGNGKRGTAVTDDQDKPVRFTRKRDAKNAAEGKEAEIREGRWKDPAKAAAEAEAADGPTFGEWASDWYGSLDLAPSTMENYKEHLELHVLPEFEDKRLRRIFSVHIDAWEKRLRSGEFNGFRYSEESIRTYRGTLHTVLEAAVPAIIPANPAHRKPSTGKRTGRQGGERAAEGSEKVITTILGGILIAERMGILTGRDDEFIMVITLQHGALRLGEGVGLERRYARDYAGRGLLRVEWQLSEVRGKLIRAIPKFGSRGAVTIAPFLSGLLDYQDRLALPAECPCHGATYLFRGMGKPRGAPKAGVSMRTVAAEAGVSPATVSNVLVHPERVAEATRARVTVTIERLGWIPGAAPADPAWHWRRSAFEEKFTAAVSGRFPRRGKLAERAVALAGEWPGLRLHGRNAQGRADFCWAPVALGMTPHGLRHSQRTWMSENQDAIPRNMAEAQMRHEVRGIEVYEHVTDEMRAMYRARLQAAWEEALQRRGEMTPESPVKVLDGLLQKAQSGEVPDIRTRIAQKAEGPVLRARR